MSKVLFSGDGTEYASVLVEELSAAGLEVRQFERAEELVTAFDDDVSSIVLVSPRIHSARSARLALEQAGGWISRTPMIAALGDAELMSEAATLRFFDDFLVAPATQRAIGEFGRARFGQPLFVPDAGRTEAQLGLP